MKTVNNKIRKQLIFIFALIFLVSAALLIKTISKDKYTDKKEAVISYNNKAVVNYNISLIPNPLIEQKVLGEGNIYLTDYVDKINTILRYNIAADKNFQVSGQYEITALLESSIGNEKDSKNIFTKKFILQNKTDFSFDSSNGELQKELPISLKSYNDLIQQINKSVNLTLNNKLTVIWTISINTKTDLGTISEQLSPKMEIPLGNKYFEIGGKLSQDKKGALERTIKVVSPKYKQGIIIFSITLAASILGILFILFLTKPEKRKKAAFEKSEKILRDYKDRLVALKDSPVDGTETVIRVVEMEDLIRLADEAEKPILYVYAGKEKEISCFYVLEGRKVFVFELV
ncbi:hypothetical protein HMPREF1982_02634 [Clostridiales bacterium oral taxon 876 str. F0540]|nr:hypothetical protein HMPREF1982_02634 [Clostridiales bacterium oral taxon 876 str. F0540]